MFERARARGSLCALVSFELPAGAPPLYTGQARARRAFEQFGSVRGRAARAFARCWDFRPSPPTRGEVRPNALGLWFVFSILQTPSSEVCPMRVWCLSSLVSDRGLQVEGACVSKETSRQQAVTREHTVTLLAHALLSFAYFSRPAPRGPWHVRLGS